MDAGGTSQPLLISHRCLIPKQSTSNNKEMQVDLRKTARGASSPAKPALHIPELRPRYQLCTLGLGIWAVLVPSITPQPEPG